MIAQNNKVKLGLVRKRKNSSQNQRNNVIFQSKSKNKRNKNLKINIVLPKKSNKAHKANYHKNLYKSQSNNYKANKTKVKS